MTEQVIILECGIDFDLAPEFARGKVPEARAVVDCFDLAIIIEAAVLMNEGAQQFANIIPNGINDAHPI